MWEVRKNHLQNHHSRGNGRLLIRSECLLLRRGGGIAAGNSPSCRGVLRTLKTAHRVCFQNHSGAVSTVSGQERQESVSAAHGAVAERSQGEVVRRSCFEYGRTEHGFGYVHGTFKVERLPGFRAGTDSLLRYGARRGAVLQRKIRFLRSHAGGKPQHILHGLADYPTALSWDTRGSRWEWRKTQ